MISNRTPRELLVEIETCAREGLTSSSGAEAALERIASLMNGGCPSEMPAPSALGASDAQVLRNIIDNIPYVVFWKDINSVYLGCNQALAGIAGLKSPADAVGKDDFAMPWKREEAEFFRMVDRRVMDSGQAELSIEETQVQADGKQRTILTSKVPLRDDSGQVAGILGIFTDITERKELEDELRKAKESAESFARSKSDFLAVMSHELRTPLTLILSPLESLLNQRRGELSERAARTLESVHRNAYRLKLLTDDILDYSRHEAGRSQVTTDALEVAEHVQRLVLDLEPAALARGLTLCSEAVDPSLGRVLVDVAKLERILVNLIGNALKFTPAGGRVNVALRATRDTMTFQVTDNGIGIEPKDQARLFQRFEQIEGGSKRARGGTGLGLSVVKVFAELMGGSVEVESAPGVGSTFTVVLPRIAAPVHAPSLQASLDLPSRLFGLEAVGPATIVANALTKESAPLVLVAEDSSDLREYLCQLLSREFRVLGVADGNAAYEAAREQRPDVVVSDVMMPHMDGFELVAKLKADRELATTPILLLTARTGPEASAESLDRGADDYLAKPFSPTDLLARVRAACRMRELNRELLTAEREIAEAQQREALHKTQATLADLTRIASLAEMAAAIAHEVNQPLAAISINASTCQRWLSAPVPELDEARETAGRILRDAKRANDVIQKVRQLFNKSMGERSPIDLNEALGEVLALVQDKIRKCGAALSTELAPELPVVPGDKVQLQQVAINLIVNATEALRDVEGRPREIALKTWTDGGHVLVEVRDTGVGIRPEQAARLFEPFHTTKPGGMGMGLSICRTIVESHGGTLAIRENDGPGACVRFAIPAAGPRELSID